MDEKKNTSGSLETDYNVPPCFLKNVFMFLTEALRAEVSFQQGF